MKYIKLYEGFLDIFKVKQNSKINLEPEPNLKSEPKIGDYVICSYIVKKDSPSEIKFKDFIGTNIGKIIDLSIGEYSPKKVYKIEYDEHDSIWIDRESIIDYSENPNDLTVYLQANKYNL